MKTKTIVWIIVGIILLIIAGVLLFMFMPELSQQIISQTSSPSGGEFSGGGGI